MPKRQEGEPLSDSERRAMPRSDTVWLTPLPELTRMLDKAGLRVRSLADCSRAHRVPRRVRFQLRDEQHDDRVTALRAARSAGRMRCLPGSAR